MIEETAFVTRIDGARADVESQVKSSCHGCQQQDNCGSGQVAKAFPHRRMTLTVEHNINDLQVGDEVVIALDEKSLISSAAVVYLWPLMALILGAAVAQLYLVEQLGMAEPWALLMALSCAYMGWSLARRQQRGKLNQQNLQPKILRRCHDKLITKVKIEPANSDKSI
ncbi:SoxR reducing system RseC family protein [Thalassotalea sp. Y01]|uniref:SoxR reducing system RseC family protein n=1 Tax=Thalassotalea sp. Y01 TaxID=2729613 RepID=UPI00145D35C4|nr:SoxR reducing system RseC family protein [Thalassotalea sp. Y01]NMP17675.1 SoxR reducing system RseC family protein [Thalassotalea sp. Y01]